MNRFKIASVVAGLFVLALLIFTLGPWVKMQMGIRPQVETRVVDVQKNGDRLLVTYHAHNAGPGGPVDIIRTVQFEQSKRERSTLVTYFGADETIEEQDEFRGVPVNLSLEAFEISINTEPRWLPFKW